MAKPAFCKWHLDNGYCTSQGCRLRHDGFKCACGSVILLLSKDQHQQHRDCMKVRSDKKEAPMKQSQCQPASHQDNSSPHNETGTQPGAPPASPVTPPESPTAPRIVHCVTCSMDIFPLFWEQHSRSSRHVEGELTQAKLDKNGIVVSHPEGIKFGMVEMVQSQQERQSQSILVTITKTEVYRPIFLSEYCLSAEKAGQQTSFLASLRGESKFIGSRQPRTIALTFDPAYEGRFVDTLELHFHDLEQGNKFSIIRRVEASAGSPEDHETLKAKTPYNRKRKSFVSLPKEIVPSLRPPTWTKTKWHMRLPVFKPPQDLIRDAFGIKNPRRKLAENHLPAVFNEHSHGKWFQILLHIEDEQRRRDLNLFNMSAIEMIAQYPNYVIEVPGLEDKRPSILVGDFILVTHHGSLEDKWYEGRVHDITGVRVKLRFDGSFSLYRGNQVDVRFVLNCLPFRRMNQALQHPFKPARVLFPDIDHIRNPAMASLDIRDEIVLFNRDIAHDEEQLEAVASILRQLPGSPPFIIFGPPGTGKTITLVEVIRQLLSCDPDSHILACAPSNSAADLLALKLSSLGCVKGVFRLNATSREYKTLPKALREFSLINDNKIFAMPSLADISKFQVVVTTCVSGSVPHGLGLKAGHFSHIFIDEAGQAMEPELMIPVKTMMNSATNLVLAGDIKQLGPIVRSPLAGAFGLRRSYLARITEREMYQLESWRGQTIIKLLKNFRSHPDILAFSNTEFYSGELQACGNPLLTHSLVNSNTLVKKNYPVIFHAITGKDEQEGSSPSFFNIDEVSLVTKYCAELMSDRRHRIRPADIGVITPYHAQAYKIRQKLSLPDITVGSVEEFQGQERRVIIMSTVRSNKRFLRHDIKNALGFVAEPRRLNVALTRAQALLIVIGDPVVLSLDPVWRRFMNEVCFKGGWRGKRPDWDPDKPVDGVENFIDELRTRDEGLVEETIQRLKSMIWTDLDVDIPIDEDLSAYEAVWRAEE